jgi:hypothetical protein
VGADGNRIGKRKGEHQMRTIAPAWMAAGVLTSLALTTTVATQSVQPSATDRITINGWALSMSNVAPGANQTIRIDINRWSSPAQRQHLIATFREKEQDGLLRELEKQPELGRFSFPGYQGPDPNSIFRLGTDIRYAMNFPGEDGGRRIVIITPRVIGFREATNRPRTYDYRFTMFEMRFNKAGKGEGRMAYATQILFDKGRNTIELENYSSEPVRLNNLELETRK